MKVFDKKLISYSALSAAFLALSTENNNAEIIYTDIVPDLIVDVPGIGYIIDIDNDGAGDFGFHFSTTYFFNSTFYGAFNFYILNGIFVDPQNENSVAAFTAGGGVYVYPYVIESGIEIGPLTGNFEQNSFQTMVYHFYAILESYFYYPIVQAGEWIFGEPDKFVGVKLNQGDSTFFGWVRLSVAVDNRSFIIKDFAYNNASDSSITTEVFPVPIEEVESFLVNIYSSNSNVHIELPEPDFNNAEFILNTIDGKRVFNANITNQQQVFTIANISSGIYIAQVLVDGKPFNKKIFIKGY